MTKLQPRHVAVARLSGDICTKGKQTRRAFQQRLKSNLRDALNRARVDYRFVLREARIEIDPAHPELCAYASHVFGLHSVTPGRAYPWKTIDDIVELGAREFRDAVSGKVFAVRTRRSGAKHGIPFGSPDVDRALGARLMEYGAGVDLEAPEVTANVDVRAHDVVFYDASIPGARGLPIGVEGRGLALISGGFDSGVAAWQTMSRGIDLDFVFFNLGGPPQEQGVVDVLRHLSESWCFGYRPVVHVVDFRPIVGELKAKTEGRYWQVLLKRLMLRAASAIAEAEDHYTLVTGDALGQVSSQTLANLAAVSAPIRTLVLRPLIGLDKDDIIRISREIGTHDACARNPEFCSLDGANPATRCRARDLDRREGLIDMELLDELVAGRRTTRIDQLDDPTAHDVKIRDIPDGSVVIDLRDEEDVDAWSMPGAVHLPFGRAMQSVDMLPKSAAYVLVCQVGLKSAFLAEQMCEHGWEASSFEGGTHALKRWWRRIDRHSSARQDEA